VAERSEEELGPEQVSFIEGCTAAWAMLPIPDGPLTIGIDGGFVRDQRDKGWFEVIAGKSVLEFRRDEAGQNKSSKCFGFVQSYDDRPKRRLFELLENTRGIYKVSPRRPSRYNVIREEVSHKSRGLGTCGNFLIQGSTFLEVSSRLLLIIGS
jgi:hypothetical protein